MEKYIVFDNGGKTFDRYTIINTDSADVFGVSDHPDEPNGICKLCGNCAEHHIVLYGAEWRQRLPVKKILREEAEGYVRNARLDPDWLGAELVYSSLPENVRKCLEAFDSQDGSGSHGIAKIASLGEYSTRQNSLKASNSK
jgi:hypothetical protein